MAAERNSNIDRSENNSQLKKSYRRQTKNQLEALSSGSGSSAPALPQLQGRQKTNNVPMGGGGGRPRLPAALQKQSSKDSIGLVPSRDYEKDSQTYSISPSGNSPVQQRGSQN